MLDRQVALMQAARHLEAPSYLTLENPASGIASGKPAIVKPASETTTLIPNLHTQVQPLHEVIVCTNIGAGT